MVDITQISLRVPTPTLAIVDAQAQNLGISRNQLINIWLRQGTNGWTHPDDAAALPRREVNVEVDTEAERYAEEHPEEFARSKSQARRLDVAKKAVADKGLKLNDTEYRHLHRPGDTAGDPFYEKGVKYQAFSCADFDCDEVIVRKAR